MNNDYNIHNQGSKSNEKFTSVCRLANEGISPRPACKGCESKYFRVAINISSRSKSIFLGGGGGRPNSQCIPLNHISSVRNGLKMATRHGVNHVLVTSDSKVPFGSLSKVVQFTPICSSCPIHHGFSSTGLRGQIKPYFPRRKFCN